MRQSFYLSWQYLIFNRIKFGILVACVTLIAFMPLALHILLNESEQQLRARAVDTPLLLGRQGSALDLVMNSLYFDDEVPELITHRAVNDIENNGLAYAVPLYVRFEARGFPIIGTSLDYFQYRGLRLAQGRMLGLLGEAVIGAEVAKRLDIEPGNSLVSSPENLFDIAGIYPLKIKVVGVLKHSNSADDLGVFVDLKTAWVIQGLGHGHEDLEKTRDSSVILKREQGRVTANAKLTHYTEINQNNINSFHFHGDLSAYPLTALLVIPRDKKSGTLLRGRYIEDDRYQLIRPAEVVDGLMENIFRIKYVIDAVMIIVGLTTILAVILVFILSLRLRQSEISTMFRMGGSRMTLVQMLAAEILIIVMVSALLNMMLLTMVSQYSNELVRLLIF